MILCASPSWKLLPYMSEMQGKVSDYPMLFLQTLSLVKLNFPCINYILIRLHPLRILNPHNSLLTRTKITGIHISTHPGMSDTIAKIECKWNMSFLIKHIHCRFDCGSGTGSVRSKETVLLNQWNSVTIYRHRWDAWLVLNHEARVQGRSKVSDFHFCIIHRWTKSWVTYVHMYLGIPVVSMIDAVC